MKPGVPTTKVTCHCGVRFQRSSVHDQDECPGCRGPYSRGTPAMRRRCFCGAMFSQRRHDDKLCPTCRSLREPDKHESQDALCRRWAASERERFAAYITEALEPFCGQPWFNDVVNRLHGKPATKPGKKRSAA